MNLISLKIIRITLMLSLLVLAACGSGGSSTTTTTSSAIDITNTEFTSVNADCTTYVNDYFSTVIDSQLTTAFTGDLVVTSSNGECILQSNAIPNHNFNVNGSFATVVAEQSDTYTVTASPTTATSTTALALKESAIFLNGIKLDILPAACYDVPGTTSELLGEEKIGCGGDKIDHPWRYDPMSSLNSFGTDDNNAHTQPDGTYHYHGNPLAMFNSSCDSTGVVSPIIGFASDGYPIYGSCFDDNGTVRKATSSYALKASGGARVAVAGYTTPVAGTGNIVSNNYDGQFRGDWEYTASSGDLDECNGMTINGQYGYYVTDTFPWVMNCFKGTVNSNFSVSL